MGRKGFAAQLPKELHAELDRLIAEGGVSVDEVRDWLAGRGVEVGRSSVHRHMQSVEEVAREMREAREVASAVVMQLGPDAAEGQVGKLLIQVVQNIAFKMAREQLGGPDLDMEELMFLASTVQKLSSAEKTDADRISKLKMEALKEAAASTDKLGKKLGWTADTARQVREGILGVRLEKA